MQGGRGRLHFSGGREEGAGAVLLSGFPPQQRLMIGTLQMVIGSSGRELLQSMGNLLQDEVFKEEAGFWACTR